MIFPMNKKTEQGFTLIELLVVIAIIGILAAMVITNLRTARAKARDASAITSMSSARAEAENFYDENGLSYAGLCTTGNFLSMMNAAQAANGFMPSCLEESGGQSYTAVTELAATGDNFCIDGTGYAGKSDANNPGTSCQ
jgi:type IV pilus assembly protein PilA